MWVACHHGSRVAFTLITLAPRSASTWLANGPATANPRSSTVMPWSGARFFDEAVADVGGAAVVGAGAAAASARTSALCSPTRGTEPCTRPGVLLIRYS